MVIELRGGQFGLKSYAWFQNWTIARRELDLKSQVWFQTKIARHEVQLPIYCTYFEITQFQFSFWWAKKGCDLEEKVVWFLKKITLLRANQIARITSAFKMGIIKKLSSSDLMDPSINEIKHSLT